MSDAPIVMRAQYSDLKLVKTRKVAQLIFEIPLEQLQSWVAMFGVPDPHSEAWCAIARLRSEAKPSPSERARKSYADQTEAERAVTRCVLLTKDEQFREWLRSRTGWDSAPGSEEMAATASLKQYLRIASRADLALGGEPLGRFLELEGEYRAATGRSAEVR